MPCVHRMLRLSRVFCHCTSRFFVCFCGLCIHWELICLDRGPTFAASAPKCHVLPTQRSLSVLAAVFAPTQRVPGRGGMLRRKLFGWAGLVHRVALVLCAGVAKVVGFSSFAKLFLLIFLFQTTTTSQSLCVIAVTRCFTCNASASLSKPCLRQSGNVSSV
jgi:hypothetical protein